MRKWPTAFALVAWACAAQARGVADDDALMRAIRAGDAGAVQAALAHADPNRKLAFGATPLSQAVYAQEPEIVTELLARGAKPNVADSEGVAPLSLACELGNAAIVGQLLDVGADVRAAAPDGTSALAICARFGPAAAVQRMLARGAAADRPDERGQPPLMWAASSGRVEAIRLLLKAGADANTVTKGGFTPLFFAIKSGVPEATQALLVAGARADYRGPENTSALQLALYQHNYGAAALLAQRGGDLAERDREGWQPLHRAAKAGETDLIALLLAKGADANALTGPSRIKWVTEANFGMPPPPVPPMPPLLIAAQNGNAAAMKQLIAAGADPRFVAENGTNFVLAAARGVTPAALEFALTIAPDANVADSRGATPLHVLVGGGPKPELAAMLQVLAAHGARSDIKDKNGHTAADMATGGQTEVKDAFTAAFGNHAKATVADAQIAAKAAAK